jgi:hypothetical protein
VAKDLRVTLSARWGFVEGSAGIVIASLLRENRVVGDARWFLEVRDAERERGVGKGNLWATGVTVSMRYLYEESCTSHYHTAKKAWQAYQARQATICCAHDPTSPGRPDTEGLHRIVSQCIALLHRPSARRDYCPALEPFATVIQGFCGTVALSYRTGQEQKLVVPLSWLFLLL